MFAFCGIHGFQLRVGKNTVGHVSPVMLALPDLTVIDPSYNLAAGAAVVGTVCGGLEDIKAPSGNKLPTARIFGGAALVFVAFAAFVTFQTSSLRFEFDTSEVALVKADGEARASPQLSL